MRVGNVALGQPTTLGSIQVSKGFSQSGGAQPYHYTYRGYLVRRQLKDP